jgi:hypothetical protein
MALATLARPGSWFESTYPQRAVSAVERVLAAKPATKIFADVRFADWLIWHDPALAGHLAYDTSFELLSSSQLDSLTTLSQAVVRGLRDTIAPYTLLVLDPKNKTTDRIVLARPGVHVILRSRRVIVATKPAAA